MTIYFLVYALMIVGALLASKYNRNRKASAYRKKYCFFTFFLISGLLALRHPSMGKDLCYGLSYGYLGAYESIGVSSWNYILQSSFYNYEKGYVIFCKIANYLNTDPQFLIILCAFIAICSVTYCIYRYSDNCSLSFFIYLGLPVFLINYSGLRQSLAIAIIIYSYRFIREKKALHFILMVVLASTFHDSSIVFLIAYPLYYSKFLNNMRIFSIIIVLLVYLLRYPLFNILTTIFIRDVQPDYNSAITLFIVLLMIYIFSILYLDKNDVHENGLNNLFWMACICQAFGGVHLLALRFGYYFIFFLVLLLPKKLVNIRRNVLDRGRTAILFSIIIYSCFIVFGLYSIFNGSWAMSYPYHFFWQK